LVDRDAERPPGWSTTFAERVREIVLPGYTVFNNRDAKMAARRLLSRGPIRLKKPLSASGKDRTVVTTLNELDAVLETVTADEMATYGLVLEENLCQVRTFSVGEVAVPARPRGSGTPTRSCAPAVADKSEAQRNAKAGRASLFAPVRKYDFDLSRALVHEGDLLLDDDIAEAPQLRCQSLRFGRQRMKFDVRGDNAINRNRKAASGERRHLLRDQLRDLYLLIHREKIGFRGGGPGRRLRRGCRNDNAGLPPMPKSFACEPLASRSANSLERRLFRLPVIAVRKNRRLHLASS